MMNSKFTNEQAKKLASDVAKLQDDLEGRIAEVLFRVTQRRPSAEEINRGEQLINSLIETESQSAEQAFEYFCLMAINLNEFVYVD